MEYGKKSANTYQEKVHTFDHQIQFKLSSSVKTGKKNFKQMKWKNNLLQTIKTDYMKAYFRSNDIF